MTDEPETSLAWRYTAPLPTLPMLAYTLVRSRYYGPVADLESASSHGWVPRRSGFGGVLTKGDLGSPHKMARPIEHVRELRTRWQIRFTDSRRRPKEKTYSFRKALYGRRAIIQERNRLYAAWQQGWDPWSGVLPGQAAGRAITLREAIDRFCTYKRQLGQKGQQGGWNARTAKDYRLRLGAFVRLVGPAQRATELTTADLERYIFQEDIAQATQRTRRRMLKTFTRYLEKEGLLPPGADSHLSPLLGQA